MVNIRGFARLGTIAMGLGIGAAVAHSPVASADISTAGGRRSTAS
jgi:hypothetical protein